MTISDEDARKSDSKTCPLKMKQRPPPMILATQQKMDLLADREGCYLA